MILAYSCDVLGRTSLSVPFSFILLSPRYQEKYTFFSHEALSKVIWGNSLS